MQQTLTPLQQRILVGIWRGFSKRRIAEHTGCSEFYVHKIDRAIIRGQISSRVRLLPGELERRVNRYRYRNQQRGSRLTIVSALETLGVDWPEIRRAVNARRAGGFWQRNQDQLEALAYEVKRAYRRAMAAAHPDRAGSDEQAQAVNDAYRFVKRQLAYRRVDV